MRCGWKFLKISYCGKQTEPVKTYEFDGFSVFAEKHTLYRVDGERVSLTPRVFDTLLYLVENAGRLIEKDELMTAVWPDTVVEENNLNKNISVLRRALGEKQGENRYIATVPGRGYKFVAPVWSAEETASRPPGTSSVLLSDAEPRDVAPYSDLREDAEAPAPRKGVALTGRKWMILAAIVLLALIAATAVVYFSGSATAPSSVRTLAVLPFKPLVADNRDEVLEMGMADTLIARLSGDRDLVVRPLAAVRRFGGLEQDPILAGRQLGVESVLDGSLQRVGDEIRVNVRLINTADGSSVFSETFDERFIDIFSLQDRIARKVAGALRSHLGGLAKKKDATHSVEAYRLYLQGRYHVLKSTPPDIRKGIEFYRRAIELDPNYALAFAGLAQAYATLPITSDVPSTDAFPQAQLAAQRALELDPDLVEARIVLGTIAFWYNWRWADAEKELRAAIAADPNNSDAHRFYAVMLTAMGRAEESLREIERARELDPLSLILNALKAQAYFFAGRDAEAIEQANKTLEIEPNFWIAHLMLARSYLRQNDLENAIDAAKKAETFSSGNSEASALVAYGLAKAGKRSEALEKLSELDRQAHERYVSDFNLAVAHVALGNRDAALTHLESGLKKRDARMILLKKDPRLDDLRTDPRFINLLRKVGFE